MAGKDAEPDSTSNCIFHPWFAQCFGRKVNFLESPEVEWIFVRCKILDKQQFFFEKKKWKTNRFLIENPKVTARKKAPKKAGQWQGKMLNGIKHLTVQ